MFLFCFVLFVYFSKYSELANADAILFGIPTRFGSPAAQMKALFDSTGQLWMSGKLIGKLGGVFFGTALQSGGQETTAWTAYTNLVHQGMVLIFSFFFFFSYILFYLLCCNGSIRVIF